VYVVGSPDAAPSPLLRVYLVPAHVAFNAHHIDIVSLFVLTSLEPTATFTSQGTPIPLELAAAFRVSDRIRAISIPQ
jgi:hypothetical protein